MARLPHNPGGTNATFGQRGATTIGPYQPDTRGMTQGMDALADAAQTTAGVLGELSRQEQARRAEAQQRARLLDVAKAQRFQADERVAHEGKLAEISARVQDRSLPYDKAAEEYQTWASMRDAPTFAALDPPDAVTLEGALQRQRIEYSGKLEVVIASAERAEGDAQLNGTWDALDKLSSDPNVDIDKVVRSGEGLRPLAEDFGLADSFPKRQAAFADRAYFNNAQARFMAARDDLQALQALERDLTAEDGFWASRLDADKRNTLLGRVLGRTDQLQRREAEAADRREAVAESALREFEQQIPRGVMAPIEEVQSWRDAVSGGTPEQRERFDALVRAEAELREVRKLPPIEQRAYIQRRKAEQQARGAPGVEVDNLRRIETLVEADRQRLRESPLEHDAMLNGDDTLKPLDLGALLGGNAQALQAQFRDRMARSLKVRKRYGPEAGSGLLLPQEASALGQALQQASTRQASQVFGMLTRLIPDRDAYEATLQQVAPDSPVRALAGRVYALQRAGQPGGPIAAGSPTAKYGDVAMLLLKGEALLNPTKDEAGRDGKGSAFSMPPDDRLRTAVANAIGTAYAGRPQDFETSLQAVRAYYAAKSADDGDVKGVLNQTRLAQAVKAVMGEKLRFEGRDVLAPWGMPADDFREKAEDAIEQRLRAANLRDPGDVALLNAPGRDGAYLLVRGIEPLVDKQGRPLMVRIRAGGAR